MTVWEKIVLSAAGAFALTIILLGSWALVDFLSAAIDKVAEWAGK